MLNGKRLYRMYTVRGSKSIVEDEIKVGSFKALLPQTSTRPEALLQIYERDDRVGNRVMQGRLRTIAVNDVVDIS
jgi:hypothetical protein